MRVGLDFDNTIVSYDDVFRSVARSWGLINGDNCDGKQSIRNRIRLLPDGELTWQRLQGHVYGKGIAGARMFDGVGSFLQQCRSAGWEIMIVSHKTEYGHHDPDRVNLREAALRWMEAQGFFNDAGYGIPVRNVYFEGSRTEKLKRIATLGFDCFIDDLEEVLRDPGFPRDVAGILISPERSAPGPFTAFQNWKDIEEHLFRDVR